MRESVLNVINEEINQIIYEVEAKIAAIDEKIQEIEEVQEIKGRTNSPNAKMLSEDIRDFAAVIKENILDVSDPKDLEDRLHAIAANINITLQNPEKQTEVSTSINKFSNQIMKNIKNISEVVDKFDDIFKNTEETNNSSNQNIEKEKKNIMLSVKDFFEKLGKEADQFITTTREFFDAIYEAIKKDFDKGIGSELEAEFKENLKAEKIKPGGFVEKYLNEKFGHNKGEVKR